jgi:hypothetical protein
MRFTIAQRDDESCAAYCLMTALYELGRITASSFSDNYAESVIWPEIQRGSNSAGLPRKQSSPAYICFGFDWARGGVGKNYRVKCALVEDDARMQQLVLQRAVLKPLFKGYKDEVSRTSVGSTLLPAPAAQLLANDARVLLFVLSPDDIDSSPGSAHTLLARNDGGIYLMDPADGSDTLLDGAAWEDFMIGAPATNPVAKAIGAGDYIFTGSCIRITK